MVWPAVIAAGASLLGGILGNSAQAKANRQNIALDKANRDWQERMSNTAYQRGTADMLKAGLNPMLAYSQGGASTPGTSAATVQPQEALGRGIASAGDKAMQAASIQNVMQQARLTKEQADRQEMDNDNFRVRYGYGGGRNQIDAEMNTVFDNAETARITAQMAKENLTVRQLERALLEQTFGANVNSARDRAELLNREVTGQELRNHLMRLDLPEKELMAKWFESVGMMSPAMKATMTIGQWLKFILRD